MSEINYLEVCIEITPFSENNAEIVMAMIEEAGFESFAVQAPCLKCYIRRELFSQQRLRCLLSFFDNNPELSLSVSVNPLREENWNRKWESEFKPVVIAGKCTVKASFHKDLPKTEYNITIDPKMAFGTGHHRTTTLMVKWLLRLAEARACMTGARRATLRGLQVLDMGTGTGILAMMAAKLGRGAQAGPCNRPGYSGGEFCKGEYLQEPSAQCHNRNARRFVSYPEFKV